MNADGFADFVAVPVAELAVVVALVAVVGYIGTGLTMTVLPTTVVLQLVLVGRGPAFVSDPDDEG